MEAEKATSSTPQGSVISSVVVAEKKKPERPAETSRSRYVEKVKELDLEDLECRLELAKALGLERVSHEDLGRHQCVDWLKAHETHFSRAKMMETADLTGIPTKSVMGPINYRPLKSLGSPGLVVEPPKHRTSIARIRVGTPAQLRVVDKLIDPREMELPDAAYEGTRLANDPRYGKPCGKTQLAKTLAVYDRADPAAARLVIVAGSDFEGTSPKLFWPETLTYSLPGAELNQMLTLVVAIKSEMPCEPELLLFAGMNDHLHATGFLEQLKGDGPAPKKIWEAIQTIFAAMNEVQENVASRFGSKTKVAFTTSPGYASMPPALQFVYAILILIAEGNGWRILMAAPNRELEPTNLRLRRSELAAAWADVSHALRGCYELAELLIVLDEVLLLEISNFTRQLKLSPIIGDDHPVVTHLTNSLWFRSMELTITSSTSKSRGQSNERKNVAAAEKQLESMVYRLTQERGRWPFLTPRLENATEKTRESAPLVVKQIWDFLEKQLEVAEKREMTVGRFVTAANESTIGVFWREHARGELRTRRDHEILEFLSPCWGKEFLTGVYSGKETIFGAFIEELLNMPISLLLALYLVYPRYLFNMSPAYMFSRGVDTPRIDGYLTLVLLTHGELVLFHRLMKYGEPLSMGRTHSSIDTYSYKCAAGLKTLLVQYLLMQNRQLTGEEKSPKTRDEWMKVNGGMPLLTDLCLAMRSDPMGMIRGLEEVVTCIYGSSGDSLSILSDPREPHKHIRWDDTQLVSAGGAKGTDEQHGALRKGEGSGVGDIQFPRTTAVQDGRQARRPHRNLSPVLEPKSPDSKWTRDLENSRMEEKLRAGEKGARGDIGEGSPASKHSRISNSEKNDPGDEQLPGGPVPFRESSNRRTAEGVHRRLGSSLHRLLCSDLFSYQRCENKFMDNSSQENERVDAPEIRDTRCLENT